MPAGGQRSLQPDFFYALKPDFPAGLIQPQGSYRFGADALLLAAFGHELIREKNLRPPFRAVELGCGCGACLLGFALLETEAECLGLDCADSLVAAASRNAANLGLSSRVNFLPADLEKASPPYADFQIALANPPWLKPGAGRLPKSELRKLALCQKPGVLTSFCRCAAGMLCHGGIFCVILPPAIFCDFCACLGDFLLGLRRILPLCERPGQKASRLLLAAKKGAAHDPAFLAPMVLRGTDSDTWSETALKFCPWL